MGVGQVRRAEHGRALATVRRNEKRLAELEVACSELARQIEALKQQLEGDRARIEAREDGQLPLWDERET